MVLDELLVQNINERISGLLHSRSVFEIKSDLYTYTVKTKKGSYRKKNFKQTRVKVEEAYLGKSKGVIVIFQVLPMRGEDLFIEIPLKDLEEKICTTKGFNRFCKYVTGSENQNLNRGTEIEDDGEPLRKPYKPKTMDEVYKETEVFGMFS